MVGDTHPSQQFHRALLGVLLGQLVHFDGGEGDVLQDCLVREEVEGLEDHADIAAQLGERLPFFGKQHAIDADLAGVDRLQPVDRPAQRRFARTGRTDNDHDLALVHVEIDVLEHMVGAEILVNTAHLNEGSFGNGRWHMVHTTTSRRAPRPIGAARGNS